MNTEPKNTESNRDATLPTPSRLQRVLRALGIGVIILFLLAALFLMYRKTERAHAEYLDRTGATPIATLSGGGIV